MVHYRASTGNAKKVKTACGKTVDKDLATAWGYAVTCPQCKKAITRSGLGGRG